MLEEIDIRDCHDLDRSPSYSESIFHYINYLTDTTGVQYHCLLIKRTGERPLCKVTKKFTSCFPHEYFRAIEKDGTYYVQGDDKGVFDFPITDFEGDYSVQKVVNKKSTPRIIRTNRHPSDKGSYYKEYFVVGHTNGDFESLKLLLDSYFDVELHTLVMLGGLTDEGNTNSDVLDLALEMPNEYGLSVVILEEPRGVLDLIEARNSSSNNIKRSLEHPISNISSKAYTKNLLFIAFDDTTNDESRLKIYPIKGTAPYKEDYNACLFVEDNSIGVYSKDHKGNPFVQAFLVNEYKQLLEHYMVIK